MTDTTRPLLLGYVRLHPLMADDELNKVQQRLADYAEDEGFSLAMSTSSKPTRRRLRSKRSLTPPEGTT